MFPPYFCIQFGFLYTNQSYILLFHQCRYLLLEILKLMLRIWLQIYTSMEPANICSSIWLHTFRKPPWIRIGKCLIHFHLYNFQFFLSLFLYSSLIFRFIIFILFLIYFICIKFFCFFQIYFFLMCLFRKYIVMNIGSIYISVLIFSFIQA